MTAAADVSAAQARDDARVAGPQQYDESIVAVLAAKILIGWLRNRQQLLVPFSIDLQKLDAQKVEILLQSMIAAAQADGAGEGAERERVEGALKLVNGSAAQHEMLPAMLAHPRALPAILAGVQDLQTGAIIYAASLLALDRHKLVNRQYLRYLAARLQLPKDLTRSLEQRYQASVR